MENKKKRKEKPINDVFISWHGIDSCAIALALKSLFKKKYGIKTFVSESDVKGTDAGWGQRIFSELKTVKLGIIILSDDENDKDETKNDWILFEAGALSFSRRCNSIIVFTYKSREKLLPKPLNFKNAIACTESEFPKLIEQTREEIQHRKIKYTKAIWDEFCKETKEEKAKILKKLKDIENGIIGLKDVYGTIKEEAPEVVESVEKKGLAMEDGSSPYLEKANNKTLIGSLGLKKNACYTSSQGNLVPLGASISIPAMQKLQEVASMVSKIYNSNKVLQNYCLVLPNSDVMQHIAEMQKFFSRFKFPPFNDPFSPQGDKK